jgi:hypothetical protein
MSKTKARPPADHPLVVAQREKNRPDPATLQTMREEILRAFGFAIDDGLLTGDEAGELYALHLKALEPEAWEEFGARHYLLSRLDKGEHRRWRQLGGTACGNPDLLDRLDEDAAVARKIRELAEAALRPAGTKTAAPAGSVVLPAAVFADLLGGKLYAVDVAVLSVVLALYAGGELHPRVRKRRDAFWAPGDALLVSGGLHRLLPEWERPRPELHRWADCVSLDRDGIAQRLQAGGWLEITSQGRQVAVKPGRRLAEPSSAPGR